MDSVAETVWGRFE